MKMATNNMAGMMTLAIVVATSKSAGGATTAGVHWTVENKDTLVTVVTNGALVTVTIPDQFGFTLAATVVPQPGAGGSFTGNYARAQVSALRFLVGGNKTLPYNAHVRLTGGTQRRWYRYGLANGTNTIALNRVSGGWTYLAQTTEDAATLDAYWAEDLQNVVHVMVRPIRNPSVTGPQTVTINNFELTSGKVVGAASGSLEAALFAEFGETNTADLSDAQMLEDDDADGMTDLDEILAELSPCDQLGDFATGIFEGSVTNVMPESAEITFACVAGESYTVYRASAVGGSETVVGSKYPMHTGFDSVLDTNAVGEAAFYTIRQNCP
jgi:hypothetical protein